MHRPFHPVTLFAVLLSGCTGAPPEPPKAEVPEQCRHVDLTNLATDWVRINGDKADAKTRLRVVADGPAYTGVYVGGFFSKIQLKGVQRADKGEAVFTEVLSADRKTQVARGEALLTKLILEPRIEQCALRVKQHSVNADGVEQLVSKMEFAQLPAGAADQLTWVVPDAPLFVGDAAKKKSVADKEVAELGGPKPDVAGGTVPIGTWSRADADGDAACTYDLDVYLDDQAAGVTKAPAGAVTDGFRHWTVDLEAPYSGNHMLELYRYRTCAGGARERIGVAALESILL